MNPEYDKSASDPGQHSITFEGGFMLGRVLKTLFLLVVLAGLAVAQIPAGTKVTIRTNSSISSGHARSGQTFSGSLARNVVVKGKTVAKAGSPVKGKVTYVKSSGRLHAPGLLTLRLTSVNGIPVSSSSHSFKGKSHTKSNVTKIGGGAAAGALIGGIAGGGKGALIGTAAGAGAGTGLAAATGKEEAVVPAESALTFTVASTSPFTKKHK
jgi:hypothetical protein